ncbi:MAG: hypothetical protein HYR67_02960 [Bacteroidetes bacterium]|nr:hypothetical protein [Bacteroidota bacterium]
MKSVRSIKDGGDWMSAYLYYNEPWDMFLLSAVLPIVEQYNSLNLINRFFFIRYWERGPHIRLRLKLTGRLNREKIKSNLIEHFTGYYNSNPSIRNERPVQSDWRLNNSIYFIDYEPEYERYGGSFGLEKSEEQFELSSKTILKIFEDNHEIEYKRKIGLALKIHIAFAFAIGLTLNEVTYLFEKLFEDGLPNILYPGVVNINDPEFKKAKSNLVEEIHKLYEIQENQLQVLFETMWGHLSVSGKFEQEWIDLWVDGTIKIDSEIEKGIGRIQIPAWYLKLYESHVSHLSHKKWYLYRAYIHMTNNRLGIANRDEPYLAYIIFQSAQKLLKKYI